MNVIKRNGTVQSLDIGKIQKSISWACESYPKCSPSDIESASHLHLYDNIQTSEIHSIIIAATKSLISLRDHEYSQVAARLIMQDIYRCVYGGNTPRNFIDTLRYMHSEGHYNDNFLKLSDIELQELANHIDYSRDFTFTHSGIEQLIDKYCIKDESGTLEAPQDMFMAIAIDAFHDYHVDRIDYIKDLYDALSTFCISLPTPMMKALRTKSNDYASCCTITIGDSIDSWTLGSESIIKHTTSGAGVGIDISSVASIGDSVKNGLISHAGKVPTLKYCDASVNVATQNGRRGSGVAYINFFDPEIETILSIKSPRTEVNKRINDLKYGIKFNQLFYDRAKQGKDISLFSSRDSKDLIKLFNSNDYDGFLQEYTRLEESSIPYKTIPARELAEIFIDAKFETGAYFVMNIDDANSNTAYQEPIYQSNICVEFLAPTKPLSSSNPDSPDIGICILSNINQGSVSKEQLPHYTNLLVRMLNNIMHRQAQPTPQAQAFVKHYASLGIGFANQAYWLAEHNWKYGDQEALIALNEWMEAFQHGLLTASCNVASELGSCEGYKQTSYGSYSKGSSIFPWQRANQETLRLTNSKPLLDWDTLYQNIDKYGLANAALSMVPPSESSSIVGNMTAGLDPLKQLITIKDSKTSTITQLAPKAYDLAMNYDLAYDREINKDYIKHVAIVQSWIDQSTSASMHYNPELYENEKIPIKIAINDWFYAKKLGLKTIYYNNTKSSESDTEQDSCGSGGCEV